MPQEKAHANCDPPVFGGPLGKAPSRGEQNDYSQKFVAIGTRLQNFVKETELTSAVQNYSKLQEFNQRKEERQIVANVVSPPMYYKCELREFVLSPDSIGRICLSSP